MEQSQQTRGDIVDAQWSSGYQNLKNSLLRSLLTLVVFPLPPWLSGWVSFTFVSEPPALLTKLSYIAFSVYAISLNRFALGAYPLMALAQRFPIARTSGVYVWVLTESNYVGNNDVRSRHGGTLAEWSGVPFFWQRLESRTIMA